MFRAIITMMDVPSALAVFAPRVRQLSRGGALLVFACLLLILGPLTYLWWRFDLSATWGWFDGLIAAGGSAHSEIQTAATQAGADTDTTSLILMLFGTGFTLLPSAVQIGLSRFVNVPAIGFLVKVSLGFDLVTDWPALWQIVAGNPWYDATFHWWPLVGIARIIVTATGTVLASVVIQSATILCAAGLLLVAVSLIIPNEQPRNTRMLEV